jgi:hypothetical protein
VPAVRASFFAFASDLRDEGTETVLENVQERAGADGLTLAVAYHDARDVFPHNPVRRVRFLEPGRVFFRPDPARYRGLLLQPVVSELVAGGCPLSEAAAATSRRGLRLTAWTVLLHSDLLGFEHPSCAPRNAFGDPYLTDLCPANPDVRAYVRALVGDVARRDVEVVQTESLHFHVLAHGYHHERFFEDVGALGAELLGLCFCEHCLAAADARGVDGAGLQRFVREELERRFAGVVAGGAEEVGRDELGALAGGEMAGYVEARTETVATLIEEAVASAAEGGARLVVEDLSGAIKGYATGRPAGPPAAASAWRLGLDLRRAAEAGAGVMAIAYAEDPERVRLDLEAYRTAGPVAGVALRPMPPDCGSADNLARKVAVAREAGVEEIGLYHYGLCRLSALDWTRTALHGADGRARA